MIFFSIWPTPSLRFNVFYCVIRWLGLHCLLQSSGGKMKPELTLLHVSIHVLSFE